MTAPGPGDRPPRDAGEAIGALGLHEVVEGLLAWEELYVVRTDARGLYEAVNPAFERAFALEGEGLRGRSFEVTIVPEDVAAAAEAARTALTTPGLAVPVTLRKPDRFGRVRHTRWALVGTSARDAVLCLGFDETARFETREFVRRQERLLQALHEHASRDSAAPESALGGLLEVALRGWPIARALELDFADGPPVVRRAVPSAPPPEPGAAAVRIESGAAAAAIHARLGLPPSPEPLTLAVRGERPEPVELTLAAEGLPSDLAPLDLATAAVVAALAASVRERARLGSELDAGRRLMSSLLERLPDGVSFVSPEGIVEYANPTVRRLLRREDLVGRSVLDLVHPDDREGFHGRLERLRTDGVTPPITQRWRRADGVYVEVEEIGVLAEDPATGRPMYLSVSRDLTLRRRYQDRVRFLAQHDPLTGLPNRARLVEATEACLSSAARTCGLVLLDLDDFKAVNDAFGHLAGDMLLARVAGRLVKLTPPGGLVARLGGDEFAALLPDPADAEPWARRAVEALREPALVGGVPLTPRASAGVALAPQDGPTFEGLLRAAETAMYRAKRRGTGIGHPLPHDEAAARRRFALAADLRDALAGDRVDVHYQPILHVASGSVTLREALVRWTHPVHGPLSATEVVTLARGHDLIGLLDRAVLRRALRDAAAGGWCVSVNASPLDLARPDFAAGVLGALAGAGVAPGCLVLEVTEEVLIDPEGPAVPQLLALRERGVRIALDDFGSGYASFGALQRVPLDVLKLDRALTAGVPHVPRDVALAQGALLMARALGLQVIAEGVERPEQLEWLREAGADFAQGHLVGRPVPFEGGLPVRGT